MDATRATDSSPAVITPAEEPVPTEAALAPPAPAAEIPVADLHIAELPMEDMALTWIQSLLNTVVIAIFVITFAVQAFQIPSESMETTLLIGDYVLVDKMHYGGDGWTLEALLPYRDLHRGDVVVFLYPVHPDQHFVKRVIGIPGDRIRLIDKQLYINGKAATEPYVRHVKVDIDPCRDTFPRLGCTAGMEPFWYRDLASLIHNDQLVVPEGHYFMMGDNRDESSDSRYWGLVPRENVVGRPLLIYWSVRKLEDDDPPEHTLSAKFVHFAYALTKIPQTARWERTLRMIR